MFWNVLMLVTIAFPRQLKLPRGYKRDRGEVSNFSFNHSYLESTTMDRHSKDHQQATTERNKKGYEDFESKTKNLAKPEEENISTRSEHPFVQVTFSYFIALRSFLWYIFYYHNIVDDCL